MPSFYQPSTKANRHQYFGNITQCVPHAMIRLTMTNLHKLLFSWTHLPLEFSIIIWILRWGERDSLWSTDSTSTDNSSTDNTASSTNMARFPNDSSIKAVDVRQAALMSLGLLAPLGCAKKNQSKTKKTRPQKAPPKSLTVKKLTNGLAS